ncbi:MAG: NADH-quinone oxidoreductase subunit M [Candidatus Gastranaerophilales bacterium]|nr:NADH-quinone oxidoreductase subunit M [Candidatus Gastranaerophilales bacterium]
MENYLSLIWLVFAPLIAFGLILTPFFGNNEVFIRRFSKGFASLHFLYTLLFLAFYDTSSCSFVYESELKMFDSSWLKSLGISASFGVDGLSLLLVVLTSFIFLLAFIASKSAIRTKHKFYYSMMFLLQTAVLGVFCAKDMFLFFLFWELELVPMYFLISEWGTGNAQKSALKFILYTFCGSVFMLLGMLALYFYSFATNGVLTANIDMLSISESVYPIAFQMLVFVAFFIGFAVKIPIIPFHTWLPDAHTDAPTPVSMILAAILLKMGCYGLLRFNMGIFPDVFKIFAPILLVLAVISILWAAFTAIAQVDLKRIIAYSSISHMGIVILGLGTLTRIGLDGAIFLMFAHSLISAGLFMIVGVVYNRCKTRDIDSLGGLGSVMPWFMRLALPIGFAAAGLPLLAGFPGELLSFIGAFTSDFMESSLSMVCGVLAMFALILSSVYVLKILHNIFFNKLPVQYENVRDIRGHQLVVLFVLAFAVIIFGLFPNTVLDIFSSYSSVLIDMLKV